MAKLERIPDQPGQYALKCDCGYDKRRVVEAERFFSCERPVEPKVPACKVAHEFQKLHDEMTERDRKREAEKFLAENAEKVAKAKAVLGIKEQAVDMTVLTADGEPVSFTATSASSVVVPADPVKKPRKKKEQPNV